jgi:exonuclease SbcC
MKPLRLTLSGFTCFREVQSLEFEGLSLFAITGPTGAGKSTLLDALTYALYGQVARLGGRGLDVLISPGLSQLYVQLELETAQGIFRITRTADRKPNGRVERQTRIEQLSSDAKWRQLPESEKLREADEKLTQLIGLDYEGFTRSVLLPQGAFDEFLRGDASKRRKLLVSLLGLERLAQMQKLANSRAREMAQEIEGLTARLKEDYAEVTPERQAALKAEIGRLERRQAQLQARQEALVTELEALTRLKALLDEKVRLAQELAKLTAQRRDMDDKRRQLALARAAAPLIPLLERLERLQTRGAELKSETNALAQAIAALTRDREQARSALAEAERRAATRLPEIDATLQRLSYTEPLLRQLEARGGSLKLAAQADRAHRYSEGAWEALQRLETHLPALREAERAHAKLTQEVTDLQQAGMALEAQCEKLKARELEVTVQGKTVREAWEHAKTRLQAAQLADQVAALRAHLKVGDACPVCRQLIVELPAAESSDVAQLQADAEALEQQVRQLRETLITTRAQHQSAEEQLAQSAARLSQRQQELQAVTEQLSQCQEGLREGLAPLAAAPDADSYAAFSAAIGNCKARLLATFAAQIAEQLGGVTPDAATPRLNAEKQALQETLKRAQIALQRAELALGGESAKLAALRKQSDEVAAELEREQAALIAACQQAGFDSAVAVRAAHLAPRQQEQLELAIKSFETALERLNERDVALERDIAGRTLDASAYAALQQEQRELSVALQDGLAALGAKRRDLELLTANLAKVKALRERQAALEAELDIYKQLGQDLRGDQFPDFLLSQVQRDLAQHASHIMQVITDGRYALVLRDNDYLVQDFWHGGEERDARTLSGGETFIASLALALALSEAIAGSQTLGALFLDEGFGTLDGATLDSVATVLENLSNAGRMVGVITHVQALTERLPTRLVVSKGSAGSQVSWDLTE